MYCGKLSVLFSGGRSINNESNQWLKGVCRNTCSFIFSEGEKSMKLLKTAAILGAGYLVMKVYTAELIVATIKMLEDQELKGVTPSMVAGKLINERSGILSYIMMAVEESR